MFAAYSRFSSRSPNTWAIANAIRPFTRSGKTTKNTATSPAVAANAPRAMIIELMLSQRVQHTSAPRPHRLLGLELRRLARPRVPEGLPDIALAGALRDAVRHRRGELDLLPAGPPRRRGEVGRAGARGLHLRRQGQPLPDPHEAADRDGAGGGTFLRAHRAARPEPAHGPGAMAAARELPARR